MDMRSRRARVNKFIHLDSIKLNLGCGINLKKGFINIDLNIHADLQLDLRKKLPFLNNSVDYIYSEHFFEHLSYTNSSAIYCLRNCYRILKKGSRIRFVIPDMERLFKAYVNKDYNYIKSIYADPLIPQSNEFASIIDYVNLGIYQHGQHKYCYDFEKMELLLKSIGFKKIAREECDPEEDALDRKENSIYINAYK